MPDKPLWLGHLDRITAELKALPQSWVDRATVERPIGVGRRAQQILAPCVSFQIGSNDLADRAESLLPICGNSPPATPPPMNANAASASPVPDGPL